MLWRVTATSQFSKASQRHHHRQLIHSCAALHVHDLEKPCRLILQILGFLKLRGFPAMRRHQRGFSIQNPATEHLDVAFHVGILRGVLMLLHKVVEEGYPS